MLIRMAKDAGRAEFSVVHAALEAVGTHSRRIGHAIVTLNDGEAPRGDISALPGVAAVECHNTPFRLAARSVCPEGTRVRVGDFEVGGEEFIVAGGPCAVEDEEQMKITAEGVASAGARILRGGAYKPRTSPYTFQGLGAEGLALLAHAGREAGLPTVTEVLSEEDIPVVAEYADVLQVGARNAQNYSMLKALGAIKKPVLLKRGFAETLEELMFAAEYILYHGNQNVILCERGVRTFETATRNTLDLNAVAVLKSWTHLPVIVDPSHGTGRRELIVPMSRAAVGAGADGLVVEVHPNPERALSDGAQSLSLGQFEELMRELFILLPVASRTMAAPAERYRAVWLSHIDEAMARLKAGQDLLTAGAERVAQAA